MIAIAIKILIVQRMSPAIKIAIAQMISFTEDCNRPNDCNNNKDFNNSNDFSSNKDCDSSNDCLAIKIAIIQIIVWQ